MAYICVEFSPASAAALLARIETEIVNMGWVAHDVAGANHVYRSDGEGGIHLMGYINFTIAGDTITGSPYMWWNAGTHTGNTGALARTLFWVAGIWVIVGDKDLVFTRRVAGASGDYLFGHFPKRFHPTPYATLTAPCLAGNGIVLAVDNNVDFVLNQTYWLIGCLGEGRWRGNVVGLGVNTITVDYLGSALAAGARIGACPTDFGNANAVGIFYPVWDRATTGSGAVGQGSNYTRLIDITLLDPDEGLGLAGAPYNTPGMYVLQPLSLHHDNASLRFISSISDVNFLATPVTVAENTLGVTASGSPIDQGTATAGTNFTLECLGRLWGINVHANKIVIIAAGTGAGQTRKIASNTADTLTVGTQWNTNPNNTSIFFIYDTAYRVPTIMTAIAYKEEI